MNRKLVTRLENIVFPAAFLWLIWSWWSFSGIYRLVALAELRISGSFGAILTFLASTVVLMAIIVAIAKLFYLVTGTTPPAPPSRPTPAEAKRRTQVFMLRAAGVLCIVAFIVTLASCFELWRFYAHRNAVATLDLNAPQPLPPGTGVVRLRGFTRSEFLVGINTKNTSDIESHSTDYMAIVGPNWQPGQPVPVVVEGSPGEGLKAGGVLDSPRGTTLPYLLPQAAVRMTSSGFARDLLRRAGANVNRDTVYLDTDLTGERDVLITVAILSGVLTLVGFAGYIAEQRAAKLVATGAPTIRL